MQILLKSLIKEVEEPQTTEESPLKVQIYCDMDGVLADMDGLFKQLSGGISVDDLGKQPEFKGNVQLARKKMWKIINSKKDFWLSLEPLAGGKQLWETMVTLFGPPNPHPVVLSAGQGYDLVRQKREWFHKHIDPTLPDNKIIISSAGVKKADHAIKFPSDEYVTHILVDDTQRNLDAWQQRGEHFVGILHNSDNVQNTIRQLEAYAKK